MHQRLDLAGGSLRTVEVCCAGGLGDGGDSCGRGWLVAAGPTTCSFAYAGEAEVRGTPR